MYPALAPADLRDPYQLLFEIDPGELLENKSTETKLKFLKEYGLMNEFCEALIEGGLMEDLVEYHDDIAALGNEKLKKAYRKITIRSMDVKKSSDNYYNVLQTLRRLLLMSCKISASEAEKLAGCLAVIPPHPMMNSP